MRHNDHRRGRPWKRLCLVAAALLLGLGGLGGPVSRAEEPAPAEPPAAETAAPPVSEQPSPGESERAEEAAEGAPQEGGGEPVKEETAEENVLIPSGTFEEGEKGSDTLVVESKPQGARVFIDGVEKGVTPLTVRELGDGPHEVVLYLSGRGAYRQAVTGRGGKILVDLESDKGLGLGLVTVTTNPPDARVDVDGQRAGLSPLEVPMEAGRHTIHVSKAGFKDADLRVDVGRDQKKEVSVNLEPREGALLVISNPVGAEVFIGGKSVGKTWEPLTIKDVPPGAHPIRVAKEGFRAWEKADVEVRSDHTTTVLAALLPERDYSWVRLYTKPEGAKVILDGQDLGVAGPEGLAFKTSKGAHSLRLEVDPATTPGYQSLRITMSFTDDEVDLKSNPVALPPIDENYTHALSLLERGQKEEALGFLDRVPPEHPSYAAARLAVVDVFKALGRIRDIPTELGSLLARPEFQNNPAINLAMGYWSLSAARDLPDVEATGVLGTGLDALDRAAASMTLVPADQKDALALKANYYAGIGAEILFDLTGDKKYVKKGSQAWEVFFAQLESTPKAIEDTWIEKARRHRQSLAYLAKKLGG